MSGGRGRVGESAVAEAQGGGVVAIDYSVLPLSKGKTRKQITAKKQRAEQTQIQAVRARCIERDGHCRVFRTMASAYEGWAILAALHQQRVGDVCDGPSAWAHLHARRRSKTRGMAPDVRHDTKYSLMLCAKHHAAYDAKRLIITALTRRGADGPLKFRRAK
jgi:hypothetical protein